MSIQTTSLNSSTNATNGDDHDSPNSEPLLSSNPKLSVEQGEPRHITIPEAIGLDFHSFIPQADVTSQVHFFSNIHADSVAGLAGLKDGDRILQINGINVTNLEHEDVRKLMQLMTPIVLTVAHDPKYLLLLQQPVTEVEEKQPEPPVITNFDTDSVTISTRTDNSGSKDRRLTASSLSTAVTSNGSTKSHAYEMFNITKQDESIKDEPVKAKLCHLRKSKNYDGYGLMLVFQQHLHVIGAVEEASPSYDAGLRENDVIIFVGKRNVEKLSHDDVKVMVRAMALASNQVELTVIAKSDIPKYKTLQEKGLIDWSVMGLEK